MSLKEDLKDWQDPDGAMFYVAICLGMLDEDADFPRQKGTLWIENKISTTLHQVLDSLVELNYLLYDDEEQKYKWNEGMGGQEFPHVYPTNFKFS